MDHDLQKDNLIKEQQIPPAGITISPLHYERGDDYHAPGLVELSESNFSSSDSNKASSGSHAQRYRGMLSENFPNSDDFSIARAQFSPVEEEPAPFGSSEQKLSTIGGDFEEIGTEFLKEKENLHHTVHFDPASFNNNQAKAKSDVIAAMPRKNRQDEHDEELTYNRAGPLLVGEQPPSAKIVSPPEEQSGDQEAEEVKEEILEEERFPPAAPVPKPVPVPMNRETELPDIKAFAEATDFPYKHKECCATSGEPADEHAPGSWCSCAYVQDFLAKNPKVEDVIYWRDWRKTAAVFVPLFVLLVSFTFFPFLLVVAYLGLFLLAVNLALKLFVSVFAYFNKSKTATTLADAAPGAAAPKGAVVEQQCQYEKVVRTYLSGADLKLNESRASDQAQKAVGYWNRWMQKLQDIILVKDLFASLKGALVLWLISYLGAVLSPAAIILLSFLAAFILPKFYETYKKPIDEHYNKAAAKYKEVEGVVQKKYNQITKKQPSEHKKAE